MLFWCLISLSQYWLGLLLCLCSDLKFSKLLLLNWTFQWLCILSHAEGLLEDIVSQVGVKEEASESAEQVLKHFTKFFCFNGCDILVYYEILLPSAGQVGSSIVASRHSGLLLYFFRKRLIKGTLGLFVWLSPLSGAQISLVTTTRKSYLETRIKIWNNWTLNNSCEIEMVLM